MTRKEGRPPKWSESEGAKERVVELLHESVALLESEISATCPAKFEGVLLSTLLISVGIQGLGSMKSPWLTQGLLIEASDGYKVLFALAEIDPAFATRDIMLADTRDGKQ